MHTHTIVGINCDPKLWILTQIQAWGNNKIMNSSWPFDQQMSPSECLAYPLQKELSWLPWLLSTPKYCSPHFSQSVWINKIPSMQLCTYYNNRGNLGMSAVLILEIYSTGSLEINTELALMNIKAASVYSSLGGGRFTHIGLKCRYNYYITCYLHVETQL